MSRADERTKIKMNKQTARPLHKIADEIMRKWARPYFGAVPYINALTHLSAKEDHFGVESGDSVIRRFLVNAATWRGDDARRIKAELRAILADDQKREVRG
jgi:hypothetical protein